MSSKSTNQLKTITGLLLNIVKEIGVVEIILDYKKSMESVYCVICDMACLTHECSRCRSCNTWCCNNHHMEHEINCDFD